MSEKKILETLEKNPAGLSISEIAEQSKLHRNTVTTVIKKLQENRKVEFKKLGLAKVYYLKKYSGLHRSEGGYKGKNISVGIGISDLQNGYQAAISAAKQAAMQSSKGKKPSFSLVFVSSKYNPKIKEVVKGINIILGNNWIGCTTDKELNSIIGYSEGTIEVLCIDTKYMHFGIGISEDYRKNPAEEAKKATMKAIENCPAERSRFATAQFMRGTKKGFAEIVRNPPYFVYFVLTFIGGTYYKNKKAIPGMESEFLEGIKSVIGSFLPIIGASASSDIEKMLNFNAENYVFANGKYYKDGAVVCFVVSELYFSYGFSHSYIPTDIRGIITKTSKDKKIIEEINDKPAVEEFRKGVLKIRKKFSLDELFEKIFARKYENVLLFIKYPALIIDSFGNSYPLAFRPDPEGKVIISPQRIDKNISFVLGKYNKNKATEETPDSIKKMIKNIGTPIFCLIFSCAARGFLLHKSGLMNKFVNNLNNTLQSYLGFYANGEIGGTKEFRFIGFSDTYLVVFDKIITE